MAWGVSTTSIGLVGGQEPERQRLTHFFKERGFGSHRWQSLVGAPRLAGVKLALLVFADSFSPTALAEWVDKVSSADAARLVIALTATPAAFADTKAMRAHNVFLLIRPVLAWQLVDLIRHHHQRHPGSFVLPRPRPSRGNS